MCLPTTGPQARQTASLIDLSSNAQLHRWAGLMGPPQADRLLAGRPDSGLATTQGYRVWAAAVPRLTAWHGDAGLRYRYSGHTHTAAGLLSYCRSRPRSNASPEKPLTVCWPICTVMVTTAWVIIAITNQSWAMRPGWRPQSGRLPGRHPKAQGQRQCLSVPLHHDVFC